MPQVYIIIFRTSRTRTDWNNGHSICSIMVRQTFVFAKDREEADDMARSLIRELDEDEQYTTSYEIGAPGEFVTIGEFKEP